MSRNEVGHIKESTLHQPLLSLDESLVMEVLRCGKLFSVSAQLYCTVYSVTVTCPTHLKNSQSGCPYKGNTGLISPSWTSMLQLIVNTSLGIDIWGWSTWNGVACSFSKTEFYRKPFGLANCPILGCYTCTQNINEPESHPSRQVGCHTTTNDKLTCRQHELSLSSCAWCSRALDMWCSSTVLSFLQISFVIDVIFDQNFFWTAHLSNRSCYPTCINWVFSLV